MSKLEKQFALYRSDEYIYGGTIKEIAQKTGVPLGHLDFVPQGRIESAWKVNGQSGV